jgi:uncharacterized protein YndB with AHSA1/START domain
MTTITRDVRIEASPEATMELLSEASRWPDWYPGMTSINVLAPFPAVGGKVEFTVKSAGLTMSINETVVGYEPGKLQHLQMAGMLRGLARWDLTPESGGTRLTTTFDYSLPGGVIGSLADAHLVKRLNAKSLQQGLQNFKALVEGR